MHNIHMAEVTEDFAKCWHAAGIHLDEKFDGSTRSWLKSNLTPPFLEHLSFRLGNQLFFIRIEDVEDQLETPGSLEGLETIAKECKGHACLLPMQRVKNNWRPTEMGWGLIDTKSRKPINPTELITEEKIELTDWELQDFAVQVVREHIKKEGHELMSWQSSPKVDPSIWFVGDDGPEWVVVRAYRELEEKPQLPKNIGSISASCSRISVKGNFAPVFVVCMASMMDSGQIYRGYPLIPEFSGLSTVDNQFKP